MGTLHRVGCVDDLKDGETTTVTLNQWIIAVFRKGNEYHAIDDTCPHMGASLASGHVEGDIVTCPWHYWRFRLTDGAWADNPRVKIGCYKVHVIGNELLVEVPDSPSTNTPATCSN
jgi:nitrite reductase (NADH) small subunit/3-phenylpropionate/trans-cinnamate dioxygenase ferredoxin subunit